MSLYVYARIQKECLMEESFHKAIMTFFTPNDLISHKSVNGITYENIDSDNSIVISFVKKKSPPYNVYDSVILGGEFEYSQLVIFDMLKELSTTDKYKCVIDFCIFLESKIDADILITSDAHDEICLLRGSETFWMKNDYRQQWV